MSLMLPKKQTGLGIEIPGPAGWFDAYATAAALGQEPEPARERAVELRRQARPGPVAQVSSPGPEAWLRQRLPCSCLRDGVFRARWSFSFSSLRPYRRRGPAELPGFGGRLPQRHRVRQEPACLAAVLLLFAV